MEKQEDDYLGISIKKLPEEEKGRREMKKKTVEQRQKDDIRVLIEEAKIRNNLNETELARYLGISTTTLTDRKNNPGGMTLDKLMILLELTGKELQFREAV